MRLSRVVTFVAVTALLAAVSAARRTGDARAAKNCCTWAAGTRSPRCRLTQVPCSSPRHPRSPPATGRVLYSTQSTTSATVLTTSDAQSGRTLKTRTLAPNLGVRAVSDDGKAVVLTESVTGANPYVAQPRAATSLTVVRAGAKPRSYLVQGNVEPEAFSLSTRSLFVIEYMPPTAPDRYRVARIDLTGRHGTVKRTRYGATRTSCRSRCAAPHGPRRSPPTGVACTRCTHATPLRPSPPSRSCTCSTSKTNVRTASTFPPSSRRVPSARWRCRRRARACTSWHPRPVRSPRSTPPRSASRAPPTAGAVDRDDGAGDRRRKHDALCRPGRRGDGGGPHRSHRVRRVDRARDRHRDPAVVEFTHALRVARRPGARGRPGRRARSSASSRRSMPARSTMSRPRCARSSRRTAPTSSAPAER